MLSMCPTGLFSRLSTACRDNNPVAVVMEILAEIVLDKIGIVVANDSARSSFTVCSYRPGRRRP